MQRIEVLTLDQTEKWLMFLHKLPTDQQDVYYTPGYYSLYENYGDGKAMCFVFENDENLALYPFLINSVNNLGYELNGEYFDIQGAYGYNGIVASSYNSEFITSFYKAFTNFCIENRIIAEFTRFNPLLENNKYSEHYQKVLFDRKTVKISLHRYNTIDELWANSYNKEARKNCKKAVKQNLTYTIGSTQSEYHDFYKLYLYSMGQIGADKYYNFNVNFFTDILNTFKDNQKLILVWHNKSLVGGFIVFINGFYAHNFLSAGSFNHRDFNINEYMQDIAIRLAYENNCKAIHFGGGNSNDDSDPLLKFKSKFSMENCDFYIGKKIHNEKIYNTVVSQWIEKYPQMYSTNYKKLLCYHFV